MEREESSILFRAWVTRSDEWVDFGDLGDVLRENA
jgi:hypothetical protein